MISEEKLFTLNVKYLFSNQFKCSQATRCHPPATEIQVVDASVVVDEAIKHQPLLHEQELRTYWGLSLAISAGGQNLTSLG